MCDWPQSPCAVLDDDAFGSRGITFSDVIPADWKPGPVTVRIDVSYCPVVVLDGCDNVDCTLAATSGACVPEPDTLRTTITYTAELTCDLLLLRGSTPCAM